MIIPTKNATTEAESPAAWLCLDIETTSPPIEAIEEAFRRNYWPDRRWTEPTIGKRFREAFEKAETRGALLDSAGIAVVALFNGDLMPMLFHCRGEGPTSVGMSLMDYGAVHAAGSEDEMLAAVDRMVRANFDEATLLVGHNLKGFDLRRLRLAYLRNKLQIPPWLDVGQPVYDTMEIFSKHFSVERELFISFDAVMGELGMESHKGLVDGSRIDALLAAGQLETILRYAGLDVMQEAKAFQIMSGRPVSPAHEEAIGLCMEELRKRVLPV